MQNLTFALLMITLVSTPMMSMDDWKSAFEKYNFSNIINKLGYDPKISISSAADGVEHENEITVYAHAWGDSKNSVSYFRNNSLMLPGTIVGFNFEDAHKGSSLPPYWLSNFAQESDIKTFLLVLKVLVECGVTKIHLFGHSRGGGTILTMLGKLYQYDIYYHLFNRLGISKEQAEVILNAVQQGSIVLNCPLVDTPQLIKEKLSWVKAGFMSKFLSYFILPFFVKYRAYNDVPLLSAQKLHEKHFAIPTFIHFQKDDVIISTRNDYLLYEYLYGDNTYLTIGNEGSHMHSGKKLGRDLQAFYKKYGNAYYIASAPAEEILLQFQPTLNKLKTIFKDVQQYERSGIIQYDEQENMPVWQENLKKYNMESIKEKLGYDPQIRIYTDSNSLVTNNNSVTVYLHGLGENAQTVIPYNKLNSYLLPGTIIGFDFPDVVPGSFASHYKKLNLAQAGDIATFCVVLKILDDCGLDVIHLFGTSRGGSTIVNALGRLCNYVKYQSFFSELAINQGQANRFIEKIQKGTIILNVPFADSNVVAKKWFKWFGAFVLSYIIPRFTAHKNREDQAINAAALLQQKQFNILVHFEHRD
jgi:hypothetical protein